jgi:hypothetical protein
MGRGNQEGQLGWKESKTQRRLQGRGDFLSRALKDRVGVFLVGIMH